MATTTNYSWTTPDDTDLVKDGASAIRSLGTAIDSTVFTNAGNAVQKSTIDAKGDLLVGTADNTVGRLAVGTNNYVLTADSNETSGMKWAALAAGGKVLQVVFTQVSGSRSTTSSSYVDVSGATASITPSSASSKVLVIANCPGAYASNPSGGGTCYGFINTVRTSTQINEALSGWYISGGSGGQAIGDIYAGVTMITLDEPATTSSTTYKLQHKIPNAGNTFYTTDSSNKKITIILAEIGA
jgi:hypothetical protein